MRFGVLFDVDGTLCDTNYLHAVAWKRALEKVGEYAHTSKLHHHIGMGSSFLMEDIIGHESDAARQAHTEEFKRFYDDIRAFPNAKELIEKVKEMGATVVLASSADDTEFEQLKKALDAHDVIDAHTNASDAKNPKPEPDIFQAALTKAKLKPSQAIVVGDTVWDVEAANKAGMECVAVLTGGIAEQVLRDAGAIAIYNDVSDLLERIDSSPIAQLAENV